MLQIEEKILANSIIGCAVAQHCYNGDVSFLWEKWKFDPCKIETIEQMVTIGHRHNWSGLITSTRGTFVPNLVKNTFTGDFWAKG